MEFPSSAASFAWADRAEKARTIEHDITALRIIGTDSVSCIGKAKENLIEAAMEQWENLPCHRHGHKNDVRKQRRQFKAIHIKVREKKCKPLLQHHKQKKGQ